MPSITFTQQNKKAMEDVELYNEEPEYPNSKVTCSLVGEWKPVNNVNIKFTSMPIDWKPPEWLADCPLASDWCRYNGHIYYADLNFEKSAKANEPIFDLAYCATRAMNGIYLLQRAWDKKKFTRWAAHSKW